MSDVEWIVIAAVAVLLLSQKAKAASKPGDTGGTGGSGGYSGSGATGSGGGGGTDMTGSGGYDANEGAGYFRLNVYPDGREEMVWVSCSDPNADKSLC